MVPRCLPGAMRSTGGARRTARFSGFSEETDWCYRFHRAGWSVVFHPDAEVIHVSGASHGGRLFKENVRSHLRFFAKHHGALWC